jgi:predicted transcriptional regulator
MQVRKTSIYLDPELDMELARVARGDGITKAELIRRALRRAVEEHPRPQIAAIGVERDAESVQLTREEQEIADVLLAEHDAL